MRELVSALIDASPVPCVPVDELELPAYYDSSQQTIFVKRDSPRKCCLSVWQRKYLRQFMTLSTMRAVIFPISNPFALPIW